MHRVKGLLIVAVMLLVASDLVSAGGRGPMVAPTGTVTLFLPYIERNEEQEPPPAPEPPDVAVRVINEATTEERVVLDNNSSEAPDLTGWRLHSVVGNQWFDFPAGDVLYQQLDVLSGPAADCGGLTPGSVQWVVGHCYVWSTDYIWDDAGDKAVLYDAFGQVVDDYCYGAGCP